MIRGSNPRNVLSKMWQRAKDRKRESQYRMEMNMPLEDEIRTIFRRRKKGEKKKMNIVPKIKLAWSFRRNKKRKREPRKYKGKMNALWGRPREYDERIWEQIELRVISNVSDVTTNFIAHAYESTLQNS